MRKQVFGITFTFLYLVAMVRPLLPIIEYYANYDYISQELCINRDKPYLDCNGRCYVEAAMKRIYPHGRDTTPLSTEQFSFRDYPVSPLNFYRYKSPVPEYNEYSINPDFKKHFLISEFSPSIFKPPRIIS